MDGEDSSYQIPSKKEFEDCEGVELMMPLELMDFISPLYNFYVVEWRRTRAEGPFSRFH